MECFRLTLFYVLFPFRRGANVSYKTVVPLTYHFEKGPSVTLRRSIPSRIRYSSLTTTTSLPTHTTLLERGVALALALEQAATLFITLLPIPF